MKVGNLVTMDRSGWPDGDEWGVGLVMEIDQGIFYEIAVLWSKIGLSWEESDTLEVISENR